MWPIKVKYMKLVLATESFPATLPERKRHPPIPLPQQPNKPGEPASQKN